MKLTKPSDRIRKEERCRYEGSCDDKFGKIIYYCLNTNHVLCPEYQTRRWLDTIVENEWRNLK